MFGRAVWDILAECSFENFEGNFKIFKNHKGDLLQKIAQTKHVVPGLSHQTKKDLY